MITLCYIVLMSLDYGTLNSRDKPGIIPGKMSFKQGKHKRSEA